MIKLVNANALWIPLADRSVQCVVTSPPYWGLRDYGVAGQLGLEQTPEQYVAHMVAVFREVRRVLRDDGVAWVNLGDSYAAKRGQRKQTDKAGVKQRTKRGSTECPSQHVDNLKPKDLVGIPWRVALALQADGWWLRSDVIWHKPNPMPESVMDRPTKAHEYVFLLSKSARYFYDAEAIREPLADESLGRMERKQNLMDRTGAGTAGKQIQDGVDQNHGYAGLALGRNGKTGYNIAGRNRRTVWTIATKPYSGAHFACYPPALVEPCIKAGTSERGECPICGKAWVRVVEKARTFESGSGKAGNMPQGKNGIGMQGGGETLDVRRGPVVHSTTTGWQPQCQHDAEPIPQTVLDPFIGSGTTALVARDLGRHCVGLDLSASYLHDQARTRLQLAQLDEWNNGRSTDDSAPLEELPLFASRT